MLPVRRLNELTGPERERLLARSSGSTLAEVVTAVRTILAAVRERGDRAVRELTRELDGVDISDARVGPAELEAAWAVVADPVVESIRRAIRNVESFHRGHLQAEPRVETVPGVEVWREWRAIERVGVYVPGGKAIYPSSVIMNGVPARLAGCERIVLCAPPDRTGGLPAPTLVAAALVGVTDIFKIGGAQAIAAMAYGTETVPRVYKLYGAGSVYVTAAKMLAFQEAGVALDLPAGPSELLVLADEAADPRFIAADLISQAEHGEDSACVLVTTSPRLAEQVVVELERQSATLPTAARVRTSLQRYGLAAVADDLDSAIAFTNAYAPEHLEIMTAADEAVLARVHNAGSVFLGPFSPVASGDYASGSNHVLPTWGHARAFAALSVDSFGRRMQVQRLSRSGLEEIRPTVETLAEAEGLPAHRRAVAERFQERTTP